MCYMKTSPTETEDVLGQKILSFFLIFAFIKKVSVLLFSVQSVAKSKSNVSFTSKY